jgi:hypothetical protein
MLLTIGHIHVALTHTYTFLTTIRDVEYHFLGRGGVVVKRNET